MYEIKIIRLGRGLGSINFGISKDDLEEILGEPDHIDSFENEDPNLGETHVWSYEKQQLSFTFEELDQFRLGMISTHGDQQTLREIMRIGMKKQLVLDTLEEVNLTNYAEEDHSNLDNPNHTLVAIDEKSLYLWFDDDILSEIQWFPYYDEDEEIIWPS